MIYLDNAATTQMDPEIATGLAERSFSAFANPSSPHVAGRQARRLLDESRERLATSLGAGSEEILFTGGGTESLVLAVLGSAGQKAQRIAISAVEHPAVRTSAEALRDRLGWQIDVVPVDGEGKVEPATLAEHLGPETRIVALMMANNEVGTISDLPALSEVIRRKSPRAKFITDAVQALGKTAVKVGDLGVDLLAATAHKLHGPKGVGLLWSNNLQALRPLTAAGGQEQGIRGGTQSAPLAWGFAEAVERMEASDHRSMQARSEVMFSRLQAGIPDLRLNGAAFGPDRLCHLLSLTLPSVPGQPLLNALSNHGVCVSSGSACSSGKAFSRTLDQMGRSPDEGGVIRMALSRFNSDEELAQAAEIFIQQAQELRSVYA